MQWILHDAALPLYSAEDQISDRFSSESRCDYAQNRRSVERRTLSVTKTRSCLHEPGPFDMTMSAIEPGQFVRHPDRPDWGLGQVQSAIGDRITVNFENVGKVLVNAGVVQLVVLDGPTEE